MRKLYAYLVLIWIGIPFIELLTPVTSGLSIQYKLQSHFLNISYLLIVLLFFEISFRVKPLFRMVSNGVIIEREDGKVGKNVITFLGLVSFLGLISLSIDKIYIQGIDYTGGIAAAKYQLIEQGEERESASSIFSVLGYLLIGGCFWSFGLLLFNFEKLSSRYRMVMLVLNILTVFASSFLTGGRTSIIILIVFYLSIKVLRYSVQKPKTIFKGSGKLISISFSVLVIGFVVYVFGSRATTNNIESFLYSETAIFWMQGKPTNFFYTFKDIESIWVDIFYLSLIMIVYLVHPIWVLENQFYSPVKFGDATFVGLKNILSKIGLTTKPIPWEYAGKFLSWPGGLLHDYGLFVMIVVAILHGYLLGSSLNSFMKNGGILKFTSFLVLSSILMTAPFIILIDILMFPSLLLGAGMGIVYIFYKRKIQIK